MSKVSFEIFDTECELVGILQDGENKLVLEFDEEYDGFVKIGDFTSRLDGTKCEFDLRLIENGEHFPTLVIPNNIIRLPKLKKFGRSIEILDCTDGYIRAVSQRERALEEKVANLEVRLEEISNKVYGETIL